MNKASAAFSELAAMEELAAGDSPAHRLRPGCKLLLTILYIFITVSFKKYDLTGLIPMVLYPIFMFQLSGIPVRTCFYKLRFVLPLVLAVGVVNPFVDRVPVAAVAGIPVSGGVVSMLTLMLKGIFSLMASFLLIATTRVDSICRSLRRAHVPQELVTLLLLTFRYLSVMTEQVAIMTDAYALRAPGQKGIHISAWGSFLGQLLLRSMDKATELYQSMQLRGFKGEFFYADYREYSQKSGIFAAICVAYFVLCRFVNLAALLGGLVMR